MIRTTRWALICTAVPALAAGTACSGGTSATATHPSAAATMQATAEPTGSAAPSAAATTQATPEPPGSAAPIAVPYAPAIAPAAFSTTVDNPFLPLRPGMRWQYRMATKDGADITVVTVTNKTRTIAGVRCVEVRDTDRLNRALKEDTLDWFAQDRTGAVWYFGEDTKEYKNGKVSSTEGSWVAGEHGAKPGIVMPAQPRPGDRYRQEYYRGHAEDMAEVVSTSERAKVPTGSYDGLVMTKETTPLEPAVLERKYYARGIGLVLTVDGAANGAREELVTR
jgi:hypothetical protein